MRVRMCVDVRKMFQIRFARRLLRYTIVYFLFDSSEQLLMVVNFIRHHQFILVDMQLYRMEKLVLKSGDLSSP